jgi:hypothetical protein
MKRLVDYVAQLSQHQQQQRKSRSVGRKDLVLETNDTCVGVQGKEEKRCAKAFESVGRVDYM